MLTVHTQQKESVILMLQLIAVLFSPVLGCRKDIQGG